MPAEAKFHFSYEYSLERCDSIGDFAHSYPNPCQWWGTDDEVEQRGRPAGHAAPPIVARMGLTALPGGLRSPPGRQLWGISSAAMAKRKAMKMSLVMK